MNILPTLVNVNSRNYTVLVNNHASPACVHAWMRMNKSLLRKHVMLVWHGCMLQLQKRWHAWYAYLMKTDNIIWILLFYYCFCHHLSDGIIIHVDPHYHSSHVHFWSILRENYCDFETNHCWNWFPAPLWPLFAVWLWIHRYITISCFLIVLLMIFIVKQITNCC